jgi:hypothetical protein
MPLRARPLPQAKLDDLTAEQRAVMEDVQAPLDPSLHLPSNLARLYRSQGEHLTGLLLNANGGAAVRDLSTAYSRPILLIGFGYCVDFDGLNGFIQWHAKRPQAYGLRA